MLFDSLHRVRPLAGEDYEAAYLPPLSQSVLARFDKCSAHDDTLVGPRAI